MTQPQLLRLTTRYRARGVFVRVPPPFARASTGYDNYALVKAVIVDNIRRRPVYISAPPDSLRRKGLRSALRPYFQLSTSSVPLMELCLRPPLVSAMRPRPARSVRVQFGLPAPDGRVQPSIELLGYDIHPLTNGGVDRLLVSYYWRVHSQALACSANVAVLLTDTDPHRRWLPQGGAQFQHIHPLAYGVGLWCHRLPSTLRETYVVCLPPSQLGRLVRLNLAVSFHGRFLRATPSEGPWVALGEAPVCRQPLQ